MISIKQLHEKTLPEKKKKFVKMDVISYYLWRPICDILTVFLLNTSISATTVTIISFYSCIVAFLCFVFGVGIKGALVGYFFLWVWNIADGIDGNIARYTDSCSKAGDLWDAVGGYMAMVVLFLGAGVVAANENSVVDLKIISDSTYVLLGAIASICTIFPRLVTQKKNVVYGNDATKKMKDRTTFGFFKILAVNITSINGLAGLLLLIAICLRMTNIFVILYFIIMLGFGILSTYSVLRGL